MNPNKHKTEYIPTIQIDSDSSNENHNSCYFEGKADMEIWRMFKKGHEGAFRFIYNTYLKDLFRYGCHFSNDREMIKDCIHDLFVEIRQGKNISDTDSIKFYLLKAFRWKLWHMINSKQKQSLFTAKSASFQVDIEAPYETKLINAQYDKEALLKLNKALKNLSDRQKEALYYFYNQDLSYQQVAEIMKLSNIKSARNLIYKALDSLKVYYHHLR